jgi:hypothetical protein
VVEDKRCRLKLEFGVIVGVIVEAGAGVESTEALCVFSSGSLSVSLEHEHL